MTPELKIAASQDVPINLRLLTHYSAYYKGALMAIRKISEETLINYLKGEDKVYFLSLIDLITKDKRTMQLYLDGTSMRYRNHKRDKRGKLVSCECYFAKEVITIQEIKPEQII